LMGSWFRFRATGRAEEGPSAKVASHGSRKNSRVGREPLPQGIGQVARLLTREGDAVRVFAEVREGAETGEGCH
jgi:hypothetical protein